MKKTNTATNVDSYEYYFQRHQMNQAPPTFGFLKDNIFSRNSIDCRCKEKMFFKKLPKFRIFKEYSFKIFLEKYFFFKSTSRMWIF